jgi:hypothetical protein
MSTEGSPQPSHNGEHPDIGSDFERLGLSDTAPEQLMYGLAFIGLLDALWDRHTEEQPKTD